jgi:general secretion pathway protein H
VRPSGFTLLEILVVLAILAIAAGIAVVAVGGDSRATVRREAQRFGGALEYAASRAQWRSETLGVNAGGRDVRFWRRSGDGSTWSLVTDDDVLAAHRLPEPLQLTPLLYAGQPLAPSMIVPLRASGRNEPATFALEGDDAQVLVALDPLNRVAVGPVEARGR